MTDIGREMHALISVLFPITRSITGKGVRETLSILTQHIPLTVQEVPSGTKVFDWTVPHEWNIRDAYVKNSAGEKIIDIMNNNLHVLGYSCPVSKTVSLTELKEHLFTDPAHPEWVPYRTSYYSKNWGFCISHNQYAGLREGDYEVVIDSSLESGHLTYGEYLIAGNIPEEVLISTHICHPSLCNDNLSGIALAVYLAKQVAKQPRRYSYRFLFIPGTIGSITWLSLNEKKLPRIKHGLVAACLGDAGKFTYKKSRQGDAEIDRAVAHVLKTSGMAYEIQEFIPFGYDERQYCSPGIDLPVGCLMRTPHGCYPEYHTSADNLNFVGPEFLDESLTQYLAVLDLLEGNRKYRTTNPKCEPQLGRRGLYKTVGGQTDARAREMAMLWVLNMSDGNNSLLDIAERSGIAFNMLKEVSDILVKHDLLTGDLQ
jgi:aminopeptidase-like protein